MLIWLRYCTFGGGILEDNEHALLMAKRQIGTNTSNKQQLTKNLFFLNQFQRNIIDTYLGIYLLFSCRLVNILRPNL